MHSQTQHKPKCSQAQHKHMGTYSTQTQHTHYFVHRLNRRKALTDSRQAHVHTGPIKAYGHTVHTDSTNTHLLTDSTQAHVLIGPIQTYGHTIHTDQGLQYLGLIAETS